MVDYSINAVPRRVVYSGSAGAGPYAFTFEVLAQTDIAVYKNSTRLVLTTDYTVTINANGTGSVTLIVAASVSDRIVITGARSVQRTTDFATAGDLVAASLNEQLDANVIFSQQVAETARRALTAPVYDPEHVDSGGTLDMTLPAAATRASKLLGFDSVGNPTTFPTSSSTATSASTISYIASGAGAVGTTVETKLREFLSVKDFGAVGDGSTNDSTAFQAAINAVNTAGGGIVFVPHGTYIVENIQIKNLVWIVGESTQGTRVKLKASSTSDLFYTTGAYNLFGTASLSSGGDVAPYRWGLSNITLDGNATANTSNPKGRGIYSWSIGMTIENVHILNCRRHGWCQGAPLNWAYYNPDWTGEARVRNLTLQRCNQAKDPDVAGNVGGGGLYWGGPTDARFFELFVGWCEGGYSVKIGSTGNARFIGGEFWGGGYIDNVSISSITRTGGTATVTTSSAHGLATGELVTIYGAAQTAYNITATVTVTSSTTFTYTVTGAPTTPATGTMLLNKIYFPQWAVISENINGFTGTDINLSGGYSGQALIRKNGFRHSCKHNYVVAGDGTTASIIQNGYQIGDSANGFTNVAGVYIDALHEDILGATVHFNSSGGFNRINIRGYCNYAGMSIDISGTPNALDEYDIRIGGATTVNQYFTPFDNWASYTPTITSSAGSGLTTGSVSGRYKRIGKTVWLEVKFTITAMGTASGLINVTLPSGLLPATYAAFAGREDINTGKAIVGAARTGTSTFEVTYYDYTFPGTTNSVIYLSGTYEIS